MSFILDALKKSENDRQQQAPAEFATVPSSPGMPSAPRWLWVLGVLLAINIVALLGFTLRPNSSQSVTPATEQLRPTPEPTIPIETQPAASQPTAFTEQLEKARRKQPDRQNVSASTTNVATPDADSSNTSQSVVSMNLSDSAPTATNQETNYALLPSLIELQLNNESTLPDLHVDIHVFSANPSDRFVFINMNKYHENDQLSEGPVVREITRHGVILDHRGQTFSLPRE
ncbi:MAG: general secretion pathway protein GspB [Gammaproteobacteria bacterium]|nr:general secretion pathway protein GspB [Gammaproteobacteria bacterium]